MKFRPYDTREHVAGMLEGPVRRLWRENDKDGPVSQDIAAILAELDRLDRVTAAKKKLNADKIKWERAIVAEKVKIVPVEGEVFCIHNIGWNGYTRTERKHKAKVTLNGTPYCLVHLKRAEEVAQSSFIAANRHNYVEDAEMRAIIDEHKAEDNRRDQAADI